MFVCRNDVWGGLVFSSGIEPGDRIDSRRVGTPPPVALPRARATVNQHSCSGTLSGNPIRRLEAHGEMQVSSPARNVSDSVWQESRLNQTRQEASSGRNIFLQKEPRPCCVATIEPWRFVKLSRTGSRVVPQGSVAAYRSGLWPRGQRTCRSPLLAKSRPAPS